MAKTNFLNTMTIIGYVFVGLFVFMATYLGIAYGTGYFNPQKEPVVGLKYVDASNVVINENGGTYTLKIVSGNATIEQDENGNTVVTDTATPTEVRLTVRNSAGLIDNTIISVPEIVKTGDEFEITALINEEDGYECNVGGDCKITAETVDGVYKALDLNVFVDVPIKEIEITAKNPNNNASIDLETANFIYDDKLQLVANVYPRRALNPHTDGTTAQKQIEFTPDDTSCTEIIDKNTGLVLITYNPVGGGDEPVTDPTLATVTATAKTLFNQNLAQNVTQDCQIRLFPIQLEEIVINNRDYADSAKTIDTLLFDNDNLVKFSAQNTGDPSIINLDLFLKPTIYNPDNNSNPLANELNNFKITCESNKTDFPTPVDVIMGNIDGISYYTLQPLRTLEVDEVVTMSIHIQGHDSKTITRELDIKFTTPDDFNFLDNARNTITTYGMEITKTNDIVDTPSVSSIKSAINLTASANASDIYYTYDNTVTPTFSKFVFFVNIEKAKNEVDSLIIDINDITGQLKMRDGFDAINARGAGTAQIIPYVVRTNEEGNAVDCNYNIIEDGTARGVIMYNDTFDATADAQKYVVYKQYSPLSVSVTERLRDFTLYAKYNENGTNNTDRFDEIITSQTNSSQNPYLIGTTTTNTKTFYAVPNSPLALPAQEAYNDWAEKNGEITFKEQLSGASTERLAVNSANKTITSVGEKTNYQRFLSFDVYTENAVETLGSISINGLNGYSYGAIVNIKAENVKVSNIAFDISGSGIILGGGSYQNTKTWNLKLNIDNKINNNISSKNYARAYWTQSVNGSEQDIKLPSIVMSADEDWTARGCKPSIPDYDLGFYALDLNEKLTLAGVNYDALDIINSINDNESEEVYNKKWEFIETLMGRAEVNEYAEIRILNSGLAGTLGTQTIQFKKELPTNMALFLVCNVPSIAGDAKPDFVRISYSFPKVEFMSPTCAFGQDKETQEIIWSAENENNIAYFYTSSLTKAFIYDSTQISKDSLSYDYKNDTLSDNYKDKGYVNVIDIDAVNNKNTGMGTVDNLFFDADTNNNKILVGKADKILDMTETDGNYTTIQLNSGSYKIVDGETFATYTLTITRKVNISINVAISNSAWNDGQISDDLGSNVITFTEEQKLTITIKVKGSIEKI